MKIRVPRRICDYLSVVTIISIACIILAGMLDQNDVIALKSAILVQFVGFVVLFFALGRANRSIITLYSVFLLVFYIFQNGQLLLFALNADYNYLYIEKFSIAQLQQSVLFSSLCMFAAYYAAVFSMDRHDTWIEKEINAYSAPIIFKIARVGLVLTSLVAFALLLVKFVVWLGAGYSGVMIFERTVPSILGAVESLYPAFSILTIVSGLKSGYKTRFWFLLFLFWGLTTAVMGDRTTGIGVIAIVLLMHYFGYFGTSRIKHKFTFWLGGIVVFWLISVIFSIRSHDQYTFGSAFSIVTDVVYELGFSFFPLSAIMKMCPDVHGYLYGASMLSSVVTGFFPSSLDVLGLFDKLADYASVPTHWIADRYRYGFGMDCSLNAEAYANFGMYGFVAMFVICSIIASALKRVDYNSDQNVFSQYIGFALLFAWFTLPRRRSYYIYNKIFWYVLVVGLFVFVMYSLMTKRKRNGKH